MSSNGSVIRSAKMKLITPPKLMPPCQSAAASGTFPTEQTKLRIAISGPTMTFCREVQKSPWPGDEDPAPGARGPRELREKAGHHVPSGHLLPQHLRVGERVARRVGPAPRLSSRTRVPPAAPARAVRRGRVLLAPRRPSRALQLLDLCATLSGRPGRGASRDDHDHAAYELGQRELPPQQHPRSRSQARSRGSSRRT